MARQSELVDVSLKILLQTEKAFQVTEGISDREGKLIKHWLPKSQVQLEGDPAPADAVGTTIVVTMPRWLFDEKGFTPDD